MPPGRFSGRWAGRIPGLIAAALSALLLFAAGEPAGLGPLAWIALVPLFAAILASPTRRRGWFYGLVFGVVYFGVHLSWIFLFGWMAWTPPTVFMALYITVGVFVGSVAARLASSGRILAPLLFAGAWTGAELLCDRWPFGGYPWGAVGTTQEASRVCVGWPGWSVCTGCLSSSSCSSAASSRGRSSIARFLGRPPRHLRRIRSRSSPPTSLIHGTPSPGHGFPRRGGARRVPRPLVFGQRHVILRDHLHLTRSLLENREVDLVVWPEQRVANRAMTSGLGVGSGFGGRNEHALPGRTDRSSTTAVLLDRVYEDREKDPSRRPLVPQAAPGALRRIRPARVPSQRSVGTLQSQIPVDQVRGTKATVFDVGVEHRAADLLRVGVPAGLPR